MGEVPVNETSRHPSQPPLVLVREHKVCLYDELVLRSPR